VWLLAVVIGLLATVGVPGVSPSGALASSQPGPIWTKQILPTHRPFPRAYPGVAYDAATGTVVMQGGLFGFPRLDTWIWDGSAWAQAGKGNPGSRWGAAMAYDAATGTVVMFGGNNGNSSGLHPRRDTWIWNGSGWTKQAPVPRPSARVQASMAYDAATGTVVMFGGVNKGKYLGDTWTWNGSAWAKRAPAKAPSARQGAAMAYDAATGTVVMFGGVNNGTYLGDTWTWNGSAWSERAPAKAPSARQGAAMAYDAATGTVVMFGGVNHGSRYLGATWTWNGSAWTKHVLPITPLARAGAAMAYDAATGNVVMYGGFKRTRFTGDTWVWG